MPNLRRWACLLGALSLVACGHHSARQVAPTNHKHNLQIRNTESRTVWVYVSRSNHGRLSANCRGDVGKVHPGQTGYFRIERGEQKIYLRYRGESGLSKRPTRRFRLHFRTGQVHIIEGGRLRTVERSELLSSPEAAPANG